MPTEQPDWPADEVTKFFYPPSGLTYRAHRSGSELVLGETREKGAGARMLEWANHLTTLAYVVDVDAAERRSSTLTARRF